jgi:hypothetical protein
LFNCCESVSQVIDDALESATWARKKTSKEADDKFNNAIDSLTDYEKKCYSRATVAERMAEAEAKDKSSSTILNKLRHKLRVREEFQVTFASPHTNTDPQSSGDERTTVVEFHIHRSLLDHSPTIVKRKPAS